MRARTRAHAYAHTCTLHPQTFVPRCTPRAPAWRATLWHMVTTPTPLRPMALLHVRARAHAPPDEAPRRCDHARAGNAEAQRGRGASRRFATDSSPPGATARLPAVDAQLGKLLRAIAARGPPNRLGGQRLAGGVHQLPDEAVVLREVPAQAAEQGGVPAEVGPLPLQRVVPSGTRGSKPRHNAGTSSDRRR